MKSFQIVLEGILGITSTVFFREMDTWLYRSTVTATCLTFVKQISLLHYVILRQFAAIAT